MEILNHVFNGVATTFAAASEIPDKSDIINMIFPNLWVFIAHTISLVILLILMIKLAWKPTKNYIDKRTQEIQKNMESAMKDRVESAKNLEVSKMKLIESKTTAARIIENAELDAEEKRKKIEAAALNKAAHLENEGIAKIRKQEKELEKRMNLEVSKLALETAEVFLSRKITEEENKKIIDDIVNDLSSRITSGKE